MSKKLEKALELCRQHVLHLRRVDGSWGPSGSPLYRITATSLAMHTLSTDKKHEWEDGLHFLTNQLTAADVPEMTRLFAWPLTGGVIGELREYCVRNLLRLKTSGGWGHASDAYATSKAIVDESSTRAAVAEVTTE